MDLKEKVCIPCTTGTPALELEKKKELLESLNSEWTLTKEDLAIERKFKFKNFKQAQSFFNQVGEIAEEQNHHPDFKVGWGYCEVLIQTHKINNLVESDFILAAKIDAIN